MRKIFLLFVIILFCGTGYAEKVIVPKQSCNGKSGSVLNAAIPFRSNFTINGAPHKKPLAQTHVKLFHDGKYMYVGIKADEPHIDKMRYRKDFAAFSIWNNDSVEVNFDPDGRNRALGKIIVDCRGNIADFYGMDDNTGNDRFVLERCRKSYTKVISYAQGADFWSVELAIPLGVFYYGEKKDKLAPRINIARTRYAVREGSDLFPLDKDSHNFPRKYPEFEFAALNTSEFGYAVEGLSFASRKKDGKIVADVSAKVINPAKRFRNIKAVVRLLDQRGNQIAAASKVFPALPGKLSNVAVTLTPEKLGKCKVEFALMDLTGVLLSNQTVEAVIAYNPITVQVVEPAYRNNIYASMPEVRKIRANINLSEIDGKPLTVTLTGPDYSKKVVIQKPMAVNAVEFDFANTKIGSYELSANGVKTVIKKLPHHPGEVWLDKKGVVHVDGRKLMVFGQSYAPADWKPRGVTISETPARWTSVEEALKALDTLHKAGIMLKLYPYYRPGPGEDPFSDSGRSQGKLNARQKELLREFVTRVGKHPAVLSWYMADEPEGHGHNEDWYVDALKFMKEIDPYHPTTICNYGVAGQKRFYAGCDILFPDTYPNYFQDGSTELGNRVTYDHAVHAVNLRPAWQCLHGFDWGKRNSRDSHSRAPTYDEMRMQFYSAFLANVKGVTYYAFDSWGNYSNHLSIGKDHIGTEADSLKDFLLEDTENSVKFSGVNSRDFLCGVKRYQDNFIIIAVNLTDKPCTVNFQSSRILPAKLAVFGEKRFVATSGNSFKERFRAHEVHIYAVGKVDIDALDLNAVRAMISKADADRFRPGNLAAAGELSLTQIMEYPASLPRGAARITCSSEIKSHRPKGNSVYFLQDGVYRKHFNALMTWTPDFADKTPWVELDFNKVVTVGRSVIHSGGGERFSFVEVGVLQIPDGNGGYKDVASFSGNKQEFLEIKFAPVKTQKIRLLIKKYGRRGRLMHEWEVYEK